MKRWPIALAIHGEDSPTTTSRIPIAVTGSWVKNGERFSITQEHLSEMKKNFDARKNGKVQADYEHASERPSIAAGKAIPAAGWITAMELVGATLYADVEWTPKAQQMIQEKEYQFVSPAIDFEATDKQSGECIGAELTSLALTNHPFLTELPALMLSERSADVPKQFLAAGNVIQVPVPEAGDGDMKIKVKVEHGTKEEDNNGLPEQFADDPQKPYGDVDYADPGYQEDKQKRYPIDNEEHIRAAWNYINKGKNAGKYSSEQVSKIKAKIVSAWKAKIDKDGPPSAADKRTKATVFADDRGHEETENLLRAAIYDRAINYGPWGNSNGAWLKEFYDDYLVVEKDGKLWKCDYQIDSSGKVTLGDPVQVRIEYVEASEVKMDDQNKKVALSGDKGDGVKDPEEVKKQLAKEAKDQAKANGDGGEPDEDDKALSTDFADDTGVEGKMPRMKIRAMNTKDGVGKLRHHAVVGSDGKLMGYVTHGDFMSHAGKYSEKLSEKMTADDIRDNAVQLLCDETGRPRMTLADMKKAVEFWAAHEEEYMDSERAKEAHTLLLSEAFENGNFNQRKARRLLAGGKITNADWCDFEDAAEDVEKAIAAGKFIPKQRNELIRLYLTDRDLFASLTNSQPRIIDYAERGLAGSGNEASRGGNVDAEVVARTKQYLSEHKDEKIDYAEAHKRVLASDAELAKRYHDSHTKVNVIQ
jgi:Mu-like prophage I protein/Family of unknown function (DUF6582)